MIKRSIFSKCSIAALLCAVAVEPVVAEAASCSGLRVNWLSVSTTSTSLACGLQNRARSFGANNTQGGISIPFRLSAELFKGIHAYAFAYTSFGTPLQNCVPFDDEEGDGPEFVQGAVCASAVQHQVFAVF